MDGTKWLGIMTGLCALTACSVGQTNESQPVAATNEAAAGVTRQEAPSPPPVAPPEAAAIQTQPGPEGTSVSLIRAGVTGNVLTVALTYHGEGNSCCQYMKVDEVSVIDDATSQRLGVLKDDRGKWMAAPLYGSDADQLFISIKKGVAQVWFKFPAPSPTTKTVSINVPNVAPFDAVPITR